MKIGVIGLGRMGQGMAANLIAAGHEVIVYNRSVGKAASLVEKGAVEVRSPAAACVGDVVLTMLADDPATEAVVFGKDGILAALGQGAIHLASSTISVALSERLAVAHAAAGQRYVAAPVFGRPMAAAAGKLFIVAAGEPDAVGACAPLFAVLGQQSFVLGDRPALANLVKLSGNFLIATVIESLGEALALVGKAGVDQKQYLEILTSTLFPAPIFKLYGGLVVEGNFEPAGFAAPLGAKDIRLVLAAAEALGVPLPLASLLRDRFIRLMAEGGAGLDWSAIGRLASADAGMA